MKPWARWTLVGVTTAVALAGAAIGTGSALARSRADRQIPLQVAAVALPADAAALERGAYLYRSRGCADCHGADGAGRSFAKTGSLHLAGPNISPGAGSAVAGYEPVDWVRTLRHGVKRDGRPVRVMPSQDYARMTDGDIGALAAYVRTLPPKAGGVAVIEFPLPARVMYGFGLIPDAADLIDHRLPPARPVAEGVTVEHGRYVAAMCTGCHGAGFEGGRIAGAPPEWPAAARLVPGNGSAMARYPDADSMIRMFRTGTRPDGQPVAAMPFEALAQLNDTDARALHLYLSQLPAR